jgi:hypothetical protein
MKSSYSRRNFFLRQLAIALWAIIAPFIVLVTSMQGQAQQPRTLVLNNPEGGYARLIQRVTIPAGTYELEVVCDRRFTNDDPDKTGEGVPVLFQSQPEVFVFEKRINVLLGHTFS